MTPIEAIAGGADLSVSMSGGKDSTATYLHLLESGTLDAVERAGGKVYRVFADTGWELPATYAYLDELEQRFGKIHRVATWVPGPNETPPAGYDHLEPIWKTERGGVAGAMHADRWAYARLLETRFGRYSPMIRLMMEWRKAPSSVRKWCTEETKKKPFIGFLATLNSPINCIGVRAEESRKRAAMPEYEWSDAYDALVWRPIHTWKKSDVIAIHQRHGIAPNPLYLQGEGSGRVGCGPCVNSGKDDVRWLATHHPERVALVEELERVLAELEEDRKVFPYWFKLSRETGAGVVDFGVPVSAAIEWAQTARGGRQMVFWRPPTEGCAEWGLCEAGIGRAPVDEGVADG